jgi:hypothetical protein
MMLDPVTFYVARIEDSLDWVRRAVWDQNVMSVTGRAFIEEDNYRSLYHQIQFFVTLKEVKDLKLVEQYEGNRLKDSEFGSPYECADFRLRPMTYQGPDGLVLGKRELTLLQLIKGVDDCLEGIDWFIPRNDRYGNSFRNELPSNETVMTPSDAKIRKI